MGYGVWGMGWAGGVMSTSCSYYVDATSMVWGMGWGGGWCQHHVHVTLMLRRWYGVSGGAKAWKTAANFLNIKCFQVSHQLRQYCRDINDANIGRMPAKAGTQGIDSDWKNLKVTGCQINQNAKWKWQALPKSTHAWCCGATNGAGAAAQVTQSQTSFSMNWQSSLANRTSEWEKKSSFRRSLFWPHSIPFVIPLGQTLKAWKFTRPPVTLFPSSSVVG